jgi:hypothetical protein
MTVHEVAEMLKGKVGWVYDGISNEHQLDRSLLPHTIQQEGTTKIIKTELPREQTGRRRTVNCRSAWGLSQTSEASATPSRSRA